MSYHFFNSFIDKENVKIIFELGSRDLDDALKLIHHYKKSKCYSFECNPDCLIDCYKNINNMNEMDRNRIHLVNKAVSINNSRVKFYPFDLEKYNNKGSTLR